MPFTNTEPADISAGLTYQELYDSLNNTKSDLYNNTATDFPFEFDNTNLSGNVLVKTHGLERLPSSITIYDSTGKKVNAITVATTSSVSIDFGGVIVGSPWTLIVL